ncbi:MAG: PDZ domain-containing protein [Akkermansiaceae bacterium]|jgi:hypothetical protein|nr:PDZ domain-containing protein [Akkermansiaceae bacterium]
MKRNRIKQLLSVALICAPVMAIEPPVEAEPIPPQAPPVEVGDAPRAPGEAQEEGGAVEAVPMPQAGKPYLGVVLDPIPELLAGHLKLAAGEGILIADLAPGGPAAKAGLRANDVLVSIDGKPVGSVEAVREITETRKVGDKVKAGIIQDGERREIEVTLEAMPEMPGGAQGGGGVAGALELPEGMLDQLPERHADALRQALEDNMRELERLEMDPGRQEKMIERLRRQMGNQGGGLNFNMNFNSTVRLLDEQGSVELRISDKGREASVFDKEGKVIWEGPYETDQDKAAVPDDVRARLEKIDFGGIVGPGENGNGMRLRIGPGKFLPLDDLEPGAPEEPEAPEAPVEPVPEGD